jgi:hypothetical protein
MQCRILSVLCSVVQCCVISMLFVCLVQVCFPMAVCAIDWTYRYWCIELCTGVGRSPMDQPRARSYRDAAASPQPAAAFKPLMGESQGLIMRRGLLGKELYARVKEKKGLVHHMLNSRKQYSACPWVHSTCIQVQQFIITACL